jgi:hypothetical protein
MKKSKVFSLRIDIETLQGCFDLSMQIGHPTDKASTACSRALKLYIATLKRAGKLPEYSAQELERLTEKWQSTTKFNPTSSVSLEQSSMLDQDLFDFAPSSKIKSGELSHDMLEKSESEASSYSTPNFCESNQDIDFTELGNPNELEDLIESQIKEIQLEEEINLLDKILVR